MSTASSAVDAALEQAIREERARRRAVRERRRSLIRFVRHVSRAPGGYLAGTPHYRLCAALERFSAAVARGESPRLIVTMPPRAGKTEIVSVNWPVWHLARHPHHEFVSASYAAELADDNSRKAREVARSEEALDTFPDLLPKVPEKRHYSDYRRSDVDRVNNWKVGGGGSYKAVGVGGSLTGRGAHVLAIDDPFKDRAEADSEARRNAVWAWYTSTAYTRLAPGGGIIVMATRWHEDDLIGRLLAAQADGGDKWEVLHLEAIATEDEPVSPGEESLWEEVGGLPEDSAGRPCWRLAGEALHPARYPLERLEAIRRAVGVREWEALYQGRPVPQGGNRIRREWFRERYTCRPEDIAQTADEVWVSADAAKKGGSDNDYHAIHAWARKGGKRYLLDRVAERVGYPEFERLLTGVIRKWAPWLRQSGGGVLIEDTANGTTFMQVQGPAVDGVPLIAFSPQRDTPGSDSSKESRATYLERAAESGGIILPEPEVMPSVEDVLTWWCAFPRGKHDDDVDAASQLMMRWTLGEGEGESFFDLFG